MDVGATNEHDRQSWTRAALRALPAGLRILDAGAGERPYLEDCSHLEYVSQDFTNYDGAGDGAALQTGSWDTTGIDIVSDIAAIPRPDAAFDAILCTEVLEHVPRPEAALREFARLLSPGGWLILTAPFCSISHFTPYFFSTGFSRYFYEEHLPAIGFEIVELTPNGNYFEYLAQEVRRLPEMARTYAGLRPTRVERLALRRVLKTLSGWSAHGRSSAEMLCYGWQVRARRK
jgi:SAM-dependent methyltransferase